jgi:CubicO group peptidase (beta-lactamase class C family)
MFFHARLYISLLLPVLLGSCSFGSNKTRHVANIAVKRDDYRIKFSALQPKYSSAKKKEINQFFYKNLGDDRFNGMFLVAKNGHILYEKYRGFANFSKNEKMSDDTPLHLASISKVGTALAILRLVDQNKLLLDEDVRNFLPDFPYESISIRMLLNHRSGIPYYGYFSYRTWDQGKILRNKDILMLLKKHKFPLNFQPNKQFSYCNTNFALLALIVEEITKKDFPQAIKELVFAPLQMHHTFILDDSKDKEAISQSYNSSKIRQSFDFLDAIYGDKNMYSTVRDLLKMDIGTYSKNFLSNESKREMFKGYSYEATGVKNYGLGLRMVELEGKDTYFFHTGWWHGNTGCYATLQADSVCIIALSNVFSRDVYRINRLATQFGNYPFQFEEEE